MRLALPLSLLLFAASAQAQDLRIVDPLLSVDGRRAATVGAPLAQRPFQMLTIQAPGVGTFSVSAEPFAGARPAGQFDGDGLYFAGGGRTVRLRSAGPILGDGQRLAFVRFEPADARTARGPVRLAVAGGSLARTAEPMPVRADRARGPRTVQRAPVEARPSPETIRLRTETARLRAELDRLIAQRQQLTQERARLAASLQARDAGAARASAERERRLGREAQNATDLAYRLTQQRDALAAERDRLLAERNALIAQRTAAEAARESDAAALRELQARLARVDARQGPSPSTSELRTLRAQTDILRAQLVERDQAIEALRAERDNRTGQAAGVSASLAEVQAELADTRRALAVARAERDAALQGRSESDAARLALEAELASANAARAAAAGERDRLRTRLAERDGTASVPADIAELRARLAAESDALAAARAALDREQQLLRAERAALSAIPRGSESDARLALSEERQEMLAGLAAREADLDRRQALVEEQEAMQGDRGRLAQELAAARAEIESLRAELAGARAQGAAPARPAVPSTSDEPRSGGAVAYLPGFDFARLANPDQVRRRLDEIRYPRWASTGRIEGDVLVLFQTDRDGTVIRTAVPTPLGGGLDALAEDLVRQMRFAPPSVGGQPTGLRSQVTVRFEL